MKFLKLFFLVLSVSSVVSHVDAMEKKPPQEDKSIALKVFNWFSGLVITSNETRLLNEIRSLGKKRCDTVFNEDFKKGADTVEYDLKKINKILGDGTDINARAFDKDCKCEVTALQLACAWQLPDVVEELLQKGALVHGEFSPVRLLCTALGNRARGVVILKMLLKQGASVDPSCLYELVCSVCHFYGLVGDKCFVDLNSKSDLDKLVKDCTELLLENFKGDKSRLLNFLDANSNENALFNLCRLGRPDLVNFLLSKGVSIHQKNKNGETLLFAAALSGNLSIILKLIGSGVPLKARNKDKKTIFNMPICAHKNVRDLFQALEVLGKYLGLFAEKKIKKLKTAQALLKALHDNNNNDMIRLEKGSNLINGSKNWEKRITMDTRTAKDLVALLCTNFYNRDTASRSFLINHLMKLFGNDKQKLIKFFGTTLQRSKDCKIIAKNLSEAKPKQ